VRCRKLTSNSNLTLEQYHLQRQKQNRLERCQNCQKLHKCQSSGKDTKNVCLLFEQLPLTNQVILVNLVEFSRLQGLRDEVPSFCGGVIE
jgi:hypothetical protein